jgi:hypothetical protein
VPFLRPLTGVLERPWFGAPFFMDQHAFTSVALDWAGQALSNARYLVERKFAEGGMAVWPRVLAWRNTMPSRAILSLGLGSVLLCSLSSCSKSEQNETVRGLQEENKVRSGQVVDLQQQVATLKAENEASKATIIKEFEDRLAKVRLLHEERVKQLEGQNATLMLELGSVRQEKLTLQEILDQRPRLQDSSQTRFGIERTIWMVLVVLPLIILFMIASKYHKLRGQLNLHVVQQASTLRSLENLR